MEIPSKVSIFSRSLELKGKPGTLIAINDTGFYEIVMDFQGRNQRRPLPDRRDRPHLQRSAAGERGGFSKSSGRRCGTDILVCAWARCSG